MSSALVFRVLVTLGLLCLLLHLDVFAQGRDTVWTRVTGEGSAIVLTWDKDHPWDKQLSTQRGTLVARFMGPTKREMVEVVAIGTPNGKDRVVQFTLPEALRGEPAGPICLVFQAADRRPIPVRRSDKRDADTVGFRYAPWEAKVRQRVSVRYQQGRVNDAQRALDTASRNVATQESAVASREWTTLDRCESIPAPNFNVGGRPLQVVPLAEQDSESRNLCVARAVYSNKLDPQTVSKTRLPELIAPFNRSRNRDKALEILQQGAFGAAFRGVEENPVELLLSLFRELQASGSATATLRAADVAALVEDFKKFAPTLPRYAPRLGSATDALGWPSTAAETMLIVYGQPMAQALDAGWAVESLPAPTVRDREAVFGALLDAYAGCVEDARKQFKIHLDSWESLRAAGPERAELGRQFLVRECRQELSKLEELRAQRTKFQAQLAVEQEALRSAATPLPRSSTQSTPLNAVSCQ